MSALTSGTEHRTFRVSAFDPDDDEPVPVTEWTNLEILGTPPRGRPFVRAGDREFELGGRVLEAQYNDSRRPGEVWFHRREHVVTPGQGAFWDDYYVRGREVEPGTFVRRMALAEAAERRRATARGDVPPHPIDLLADLGALRPQPAETVNLGSPLPSEVMHPSAVNPAIGVLREAWSARTTLRRIDFPELPPVVGPRAIIEMLTLDGVELSLVSGHLLVQASLLRADHREVIERAAPLIKAVLAGTPLRCALDHGKAETPEAVTLALVDVPVCAEHVGGPS